MTRGHWLVLCLVVAALVLGGAGLTLSYLTTKHLRGTVSDPKGTPIAGAVVTLAGRSTFTDAQGRFEIQVPRGTWLLIVFADGYQSIEQIVVLDDWLTTDYTAPVTLIPKEML